jgi:ribosome biogenesis GTPase / thiamine phosphate phosphatase
MLLPAFGWDEHRAREFEAWADKAGVEPGRVAIEFNHIFRVIVEGGEIEVTTSGRLKHQASSRSELPAVGDWVVVRRRADQASGDIVAVLPRRSCFSRKAAGNVTDEQVVAANVDVAFIVMGLDADFNLRRLERYLLLARESGASPVILLTKTDLAADLPARMAEVTALASGVPVHALSPRRNEGLEQVTAYLRPGRTAALLGSSGVGKSTIINRLAGDEARRTREVRGSDSRGRHTTTHRELVTLPDGGLIIDTPGMRELQLWDVGEAVSETFDDIEMMTSGCRFTDCRHRNEPGCAVKAAVADGRLASARLESYLKLQDEVAFLARQQDERAQLEEKRRSKVIHKALKQHLKAKRG